MRLRRLTWLQTLKGANMTASEEMLINTLVTDFFWDRYVQWLYPEAHPDNISENNIDKDNFENRKLFLIELCYNGVAQRRKNEKSKTI